MVFGVIAKLPSQNGIIIAIISVRGDFMNTEVVKTINNIPVLTFTYQIKPLVVTTILYHK